MTGLWCLRGVLWCHGLRFSLELTFVHGEWVCSNLVHVHSFIQVCQHHWLKRLTSSLNSLDYFVEDPLSLGMQVYFWALCSVPLILKYVFVLSGCLDYFTIIVVSKVWEGTTSRFVMFLQDCFGDSGSLMAIYKF